MMKSLLIEMNIIMSIVFKVTLIYFRMGDINSTVIYPTKKYRLTTRASRRGVPGFNLQGNEIWLIVESDNTRNIRHGVKLMLSSDSCV